MNLPLPAPIPVAEPTPAIDATTGRGFVSRGRWLGLIGPAFVAAIAFVDPGNIATNVTAGVQYRYLLLWTVITASLMAMLVQYLSAKLGLATGCSLAEVCREHTSTPTRILLWLTAEAVVIMTDLAEFVGGAVALNLLFGLDLVTGGVVICAATMVILRLRLAGRDGFPVAVVVLLFTLVAAFGYLVLRSPFDAGPAASGMIPGFAGTDSVLLACGIVGATVMPHAVFLHSSLVGGLAPGRVRTIGTASMLRFLRRDVIIAMGVAGLVNVMMLLVATSLPSGTGGSLDAVHSAFGTHRGAAFATIFAIGLLASGLASASAGVYAGQEIMRGFLKRDSSVWLRRVISSAPALAVLALVDDPTQALVVSQVALSFGLPFALVPLMIFTSRRPVMGSFINRIPTVVAGVTITAIIVGLNFFLLARSATAR